MESVIKAKIKMYFYCNQVTKKHKHKTLKQFFDRPLSVKPFH